MNKLIWTRMETQSPTSNVGPNFSERGTTPTVVVPGKFGNGLYSSGVPDAYQGLVADANISAASTTNWTKFTIQQWLNLDNALLNGIPLTGNMFNCFTAFCDDADPVYPPELMFLFIGYVNGLYCYFAGTSFILSNASLTWAANETHCLTISCDMAGIGGSGDTIRIYLDNNPTPIGTSSITWPTISSALRPLLLNKNTDVNSLQGWMDDFQMYDAAKTDVSDVIYEGDIPPTPPTSPKRRRMPIIN